MIGSSNENQVGSARRHAQETRQTVFATIESAAPLPALNRLLYPFGFHAVPTERPALFDIASFTRRSDPVVERDLMSSALSALTSARTDGALPLWTLVWKPEKSR